MSQKNADRRYLRAPRNTNLLMIPHITHVNIPASFAMISCTIQQYIIRSMLIWFCLRKIFTTALLFLAFIAPVSVASADDYPDTYLSDIYLTTEDRNGVPMRHAQDPFHCSDKIYGVVKGRWPDSSEHLLEAYWTDPRSKQREHTQYKFNAGKEKRVPGSGCFCTVQNPIFLIDL